MLCTGWQRPSLIVVTKNFPAANLGMGGSRKRCRTLLEQLSDGVGESLPLVCQGGANREIKAFLRGQLAPGRTEELQTELLAAGIPL